MKCLGVELLSSIYVDSVFNAFCSRLQVKVCVIFDRDVAPLFIANKIRELQYSAFLTIK